MRLEPGRPVWKGALLLLALAPLWAGLSFGGGQVAPAKATVQEVSEGLTCQCGCGLTVANCNHPSCSFAVPIRAEIESMLGQGKSRTAVLTLFRHKYGEKILSAPTAEGFNLLAWVMPFVAMGAGAVLIVVAAGKWRHAREAAGSEEGRLLGAIEDRHKRALEEEIARRP